MPAVFISLEYALEEQEEALVSDTLIDKASQTTAPKISLLSVKAVPRDGRALHNESLA